MRLLVIRHGESEADILNVHEGRADFPLTERGHKQAEAMAACVAASCPPSVVYHSTLRRAEQTARHLADACAAPLRPKDELREFDNGLIAGLDHETAKKLYPYQPNLPPHASVYEQESAFEFRFRLERALSLILSQTQQDATVAVVTHGGAIMQLYRAFLGLPVVSHVVFATGDTGIHEWRIERGERVIARANDLSHIAAL